MIKISDKNIKFIANYKQPISKVYHGTEIVWGNIIDGCFTNGYWLNDKKWTNDKGWKNN